jgi:hypothetical protein
VPAHHRTALSPARPGERAALVAILAVAALLRLWRLDLMEFKADEAQACQLALQVLGHLRGSAPAGQDFPLVGLLSSVGVPNPPLFIYLVALPLAFVRDPLAAAAFIGLCNVAAVGLCYWIGRRYFSPFVALASAALYALAPWAVIFSRKIWAQDLLPVFLGAFLLAAHAFLVERRPRALAWLLVLAAAAMQLHLSALILAGALAGLLVAGRSVVRARWLGLGAAAALVLCAPYLLHLAQTRGSDFAHLGAWRNESARLVPASQRLLWALRFPLSISGADATDALVGTQAAWVFPFAVATGLAAAGGLGWLCWRDRRTPLFPARLMLAVWLVLPTLGLAATGAVPIIHYFIVLYPLVFLGLAAALEAGLPRWRAVSWTALAGCLAGYAWLDAALFRSVAERGGAPSDYGVAYAEKAGAIDFVLGETPMGFPVLFDGAHPDGGLPPEYRFLLVEKSRGRAALPAGAAPVGRYLLIDSFRFQLTAAGLAGTRNLPRREFGPLTIFALPPP